MKTGQLAHITIASFKEAHISQVKSIFDRQFGEGYLTTAYLLSRVNDPHSLSVVALSGDEVLGISITIMGTAEALSETLLKGKSRFIDTLKSHKHIGLRKHTAVQPGYEGKGVGSKMAAVSIKQLEASCQAIVSIIWQEGSGAMMKKLLSRNQFTPLFTIVDYWKQDSIELQYICPKCQGIPCGCSVVVYVKTTGGKG